MSAETRTYDKHWMPWLEKALVARGIPVQRPLMPNPWEADYEAYKAKFSECAVGEVTVLIGHSCGSAFLVRWLGETQQKVAKLILVAPWKVNEDGDIYREKFYGFPIDASIRDRVGEIVMFTAPDEEDGGKESLRMFHDALGGEVVSLDHHGHYTLDDMKTNEFPELLEVVLR